jgi:hypothetical protein
MIYTREDKEEIQPNKVRSSELIPVERWTQVQQARTCVVVLTLKYVTIVSPVSSSSSSTDSTYWESKIF